MTVLQPVFLWSLVLASIPIILYILFRRRRNEVAWGSTYILQLAVANARRKTLWKQIVIIALRTLFLALLVLAFARPFLPSTKDSMGQQFPHGQGTLHRIVLVDNSLSMNARHNVGTRFDLARQALAGLLTSTKPGDIMHVIPLCAEDATSVKAQSLSCPVSAGEADDFVGTLQPQPSALNFVAGMRVASELCREHAAATRQVIVITDLSARDHEALDDYGVFGEVLDGLGVRVAVLDLGAKGAHNLAIESVTTGSELLLAGQPTNLYVRVKNFSDGSREDSQLQLFVDEKLTAEQACVLPSGHGRTFEFSVTLPAGNHNLEVRLSDDSYEPDNIVRHFVHVQERLGLIAVVPDEEAGDDFTKETAFLERVIAASDQAAYQLQMDVIKASMFTPNALADKQVVVCGTDALPRGMFTPLETFVQRGGGLIFAASNQTNAEAFNAAYARFLPALLAKPFRDEFDEERYLALDTGDMNLPLLREFEKTDNGDLARGRIYNHFRLTTVDGVEDVQTLMRLANGDPLLLSRRLGRGTVCLWATSVGGAWSSLPVRQAYLPMMVRLFNYAGGFGRPARNVDQGAPLILQTTGASSSLYLTTPDAKLIECDVVKTGDRVFVRIDDTAVAGVYDIQNEGGETLASFSVALSLDESDLRTLNDNERERFSTLISAPLAENIEGLRHALWREGDGVEHTAVILFLIAALLLSDACLTRFWFS